ncbi:MAG: GNAT family N-acetyltransferase [Dolichospermum sp. DL01]|jgi:ribosomal protein S18 acetylase RimI-like enzyme|nr:MAG: GNAT family N-acetyltransferase [Dolichospermum sp. DL01]
MMLTNKQKICIDFSYEVLSMTDADIEDVLSFLRNFSEVHFCTWENEILLRDILSSKRSACYIARSSNETVGNYIVGALIGGTMGVRATINHLAVHKAYRKRGIARKLVSQAFVNFQLQGIRRVFLFIIDEAADAQCFWTKVGFKSIVNETTYELDLPQGAIHYSETKRRC